MKEVAMLAHAAHVALHTGVVQGGLVGLATAVAVDLQAFRSWKCWDDVHRYDWGLASFRWVQGFLIGALGAAGLKAVV